VVGFLAEATDFSLHQTIQSGLGTHLVSCSVGAGDNVIEACMQLTVQQHLVLKLRVGGVEMYVRL